MMDVDELESVVDEMSKECGDQIDTLYDTVTINADTYNGFICRLREIARLAKCPDEKKSAEPGNMAAMREALEWIAHYTDNRANMDDPGCADGYTLADKARAALAAPLRNCDVGTVVEQEDRFFNFCKSHDCTVNCPVRKKWNFAWEHNPSCGVLFSLMPYKEGGANV